VERNELDLVVSLKSSTGRVGPLYPVLEDFHGNLIDGRHRLEADSEWPRMRLENVKTEKDRIIARLISNACRRGVSASEKKEMLGDLGQILLDEYVEPGEISKKIAEETGMTRRWVTKYLPDKFKDTLQSQRRSNPVERRSTASSRALLSLVKPPGKKLLEIGKYKNTDYAIYTVKKPLQERVEGVAVILKTTPEILVQNIIEEKLREIMALKRGDIEGFTSKKNGDG